MTGGVGARILQQLVAQPPSSLGKGVPGRQGPDDSRQKRPRPLTCERPKTGFPWEAPRVTCPLHAHLSPWSAPGPPPGQPLLPCMQVGTLRPRAVKAAWLAVRDSACALGHLSPSAWGPSRLGPVEPEAPESGPDLTLTLGGGLPSWGPGPVNHRVFRQAFQPSRDTDSTAGFGSFTWGGRPPAHMQAGAGWPPGALEPEVPMGTRTEGSGGQVGVGSRGSRSDPGPLPWPGPSLGPVGR